MSELFLCEIEQRDKRSAAVTREYSRILDNSDMQIVIFLPKSQMLPKTRKLWLKLICDKSVLNTILHFWVIYAL